MSKPFDVSEMDLEVLGAIRGRLGLEEKDPSKDQEIAAMTPRRRLELVCGWEFGDPSWAASFLEWAEQCGFEVREEGRCAKGS